MKSMTMPAVCLGALLFALPAANAQDSAPIAQEVLPLSQGVSGPSVSLHDAIKTALQNSPFYAAAIDRSEAMKAVTSKAGALPNPEVSFEMENFSGSGPYSGTENAELTYGVSQLVELPGKRSGRVNAARGEEKKSLFEREAARLDLIRDVVTAYATLVAAEEELDVLREEKSMATNVYDSVVAKVDAGKEPPIQKNKAAIELSSSNIALERAERSVQTAKRVLANLMGVPSEGLVALPGTLPEMKSPLGLSAYADMIASTPDNLAYDASIETAQSNLSYERAGMVPDPTFNVGVRDYREDGEKAFLAGVSIPFPVFDMNRAGVRRAGHEYNAAMLDKAQALLSSETALAENYELFANAYQENKTLNEVVLPGAQEAFDAARIGYNAGKFGYLEVLDAQRTLFDARKQAIQTMLDYYRAMAVIDRMTAIHSTQTQKEKTP